ncbi:hypothetical protein ABT255_54255 [Streptomyces mirabilis]|uniref:hypothetical protein n=1 Tax=Streptomyces mirabilis TaxID=68239 RepID=UPI00332943AD
MQTPGLVKLFVDMSAAADPALPAHRFMPERSARILELVRRLLGPGNNLQARALIAALDGLQIQWLCDPSLDIVGDLRRPRGARCGRTCP